MKPQNILLCMLLCLSPALWAALPDQDNNNTLTYDGQTIPGSTDIVAGHGQQTADDNLLTITNSTIENNNSPLHNSQIVGGWAVYNTANNNRIEINNSTVNRNMVGGQSTFGTQANNNIISINASQVSQGAPLQEITTLSDYQVEHRYDDQGNDVYSLASMATDTMQVSGELEPESSNYTTYGGSVANGEAAYNQIIVSGSNGTIGNNLIAAYSPYLAETHLHDNLVQVTDAQVSGLIAGATSLGASWDVNIKDPLTNDNNAVRIISSQVNDVIGAYGGLTTNGNSVLLVNSSARDLYGVSYGQNIFYSGGQPQTIENTAYNNSVTLQNASTVTGNIYGAQSHSVQAQGNQVNISGGSSAQGNIYGAHVSNARVQINDDTVAWNSVQTGAQQNTVFLDNATAGNSSAQIAGALTFSGWATGNAVQITASTVTASTLAGGWAEHERQTLTAEGQTDLSIGYTADRNAVTSAESQIVANIYGGLVSRQEEQNPNGVADTTLSSASSNFVSLDTSAISGNIYGGAALGDYTSANNNRVWLTQTLVNGDVYGGFAEGNNATSQQNEVILHNTYVNGDVFGSSGTQGGGNTVTLSGQGAVSGTVYGGGTGNNQLTLLNFQSSTPLNLSGFDKPYLISGADTSVTFAQDVAQGEVYVQGIADVNDHVMLRTPDENSVFNLHSVDSGVYTYSLTPQNQPDGWTNWLLSGGFSAQRAETYAQTAMAALALANAGDNLLDNVLEQAAQTQESTGTFLQTGYQDAKHQTGSGIRLHATTALAGLYSQTDNWTGGFYARYAYGDYKTYPVHSESYATSWAGGLFGAWNGLDNLRLTADARVGWQRSSYGGSQETGSTFDYEGVFTSLQAGGKYSLSSAWYADARLRWTHIQGDSLTDNLGERIYVSGSDSLLSSVGLTFKPQALSFGFFSPMAKAELLHEFNGKGVSRVEGHRLDTLSLRGTTGRATLALAYDNPFAGIRAALSGFAEGGQTDGWGLRLEGALRF